MPNPISKQLDKLRKAVLPTVKGFLLQEGPERLSVYYNDYLQPNTKPDKSKSGRLYYKRPNTSDKLRTLFGNIQRAISPDARGGGNITDVDVKGTEIVFRSGIDWEANVTAGNETTDLRYAGMHEGAIKTSSAFTKRPFLQPGFEDFNKQEMPLIIQDIGEELLKVYNG